MEELIELIRRALAGDEQALAQLQETPVDTIEAATGSTGEDVDPLAVISQALAGTELDADTQAAVMQAVTDSAGGYAPADGGYEPAQLADIFAQGINVTVEEGDQIHVDNSLYVDGNVKGGIHQANTTDITDADDGAIIAEGAHDSNFQTGEGNVQLDHVNADNITTGDNNTVASDYSTIGNENVDAGHIENSEFGEGDQDRSQSLDLKIDDSFNDDDVHKSTYTDDDNTYTDVDIDVDKGGHGYEAPKPDYEPEPDYDHHDDEVYD
ncbi:MAG: hypothetical protein AAFN30_16430 [Actinomycetota bacterium]